MALLLALTQSFIDPDNLQLPGLSGLVVPLVSTDLQSGKCNASLQAVHTAKLELFCRLTKETIGTLSAQELWPQLVQVQTQLPFAKLVFPICPQSLELVKKSAQFGWNWQLHGVTTITQAAMALTCHAGAIWIEVGMLDGKHEFEGDELCSQTRSYIDEHFVTGQKPLIIASDVRDQDHIERTLLYGCDRVVITEELWQTLTH